MPKGFDRNDPMWDNDPQVCRDKYPNWKERIEKMVFNYSLSIGEPPTTVEDPEERKRYIAFLKENKSPLADGY